MGIKFLKKFIKTIYNKNYKLSDILNSVNDTDSRGLIQDIGIGFDSLPLNYGYHYSTKYLSMPDSDIKISKEEFDKSKNAKELIPKEWYNYKVLSFYSMDQPALFKSEKPISRTMICIVLEYPKN